MPDEQTGTLRSSTEGGRSDKTPTTFVKLHGANTADDHETWEPGEVARALNSMGQAGTNGALALSPSLHGFEHGTNGALERALRPQMAATTGTVRRLTPTECERLQGFEDGWTIPYGPSLA